MRESENPIIIIGNSIKNRFVNNFLLDKKDKKIIPSSIILDIKKSANSVGINYLGFKTISKNCVENSDICLAINLDDTVMVRKLFKDCTSKLVWLNSFGSKFATNADFLIPTLTAFESENISYKFGAESTKNFKISSWYRRF